MRLPTIPARAISQPSPSLAFWKSLVERAEMAISMPRFSASCSRTFSAAARWAGVSLVMNRSWGKPAPPGYPASASSFWAVARLALTPPEMGAETLEKSFFCWVSAMPSGTRL